MPPVRTETLKMFRDLADTRSFAQAARLNSVTAPAVNQHLASLEREFKSTLIKRSREKHRLTPEGQVLYEHSKQIVELEEALWSKIDKIKQIVSGMIRVATIPSIGLHDLPRPIQQLAGQYSTVNVHVEFCHADQVYAKVLTGVADLGLVAYPARLWGLTIIPLCQDLLVLACHPQHPLARQAAVSLKSLAGQRLVGFAPGLPARRALDRIFRQHRVTTLYAMEFDNVETIKQAVEIDAGVAILPQSTIRQEVAKQMLAALPIAEGNFHRPLAAIHKRRKMLSPALKRLLILLQAHRH